MLSGKVMVIHLTVGSIKKMLLYKMSQYFPRPHDPSGGNIKVELDLSCYATKADLKGAPCLDTSNLDTSDLASLKVEGYKIDVDKLKTVPADLIKISK